MNAAKRKATTERPDKDSSQSEKGEAETSKKVRCFNRKWSEEFGWLRYDDKKKNMFCQTCREAFQTATGSHTHCPTEASGKAFLSGSQNFQRSALTRHHLLFEAFKFWDPPILERTPDFGRLGVPRTLDFQS